MAVNDTASAVNDIAMVTSRAIRETLANIDILAAICMSVFSESTVCVGVDEQLGGAAT